MKGGADAAFAEAETLSEEEGHEQRVEVPHAQWLRMKRSPSQLVAMQPQACPSSRFYIGVQM